MTKAAIILRKMDMLPMGARAASEMASLGMQVYLLAISDALVSAPLSEKIFQTEEDEIPNRSIFGFHRETIESMANLLREAEVVIPL